MVTIKPGSMMNATMVKTTFLSAATVAIGLTFGFPNLNAAKPEDLIHIHSGGIPVVISAPHGGNLPIPDGERSTEGTTVRDLHTKEIALELARLLEEELGAKPYYAIARFSRRYVDANRGPGFRPQEAFSGPNSQRVYQAYHRALRSHVDEVRETFGSGLLIDLHGQSRFPDQIIRGTVGGLTVKALLETHGLEALIGPNSVFGHLHAHGFTVEPPVENAPESPADEVHFVGGYIVRAYGSHRENGIDSIQIELGRDYRQPGQRDKTTAALAQAIAAHVNHFLSTESAPAEAGAAMAR